MSTPLDRLPPTLRRFRRQLRVKAAYRDLFDSDAGRLVLHDLARRGGLHETSFEPGDPHHTAFREGRRSMVLEVLQMLRWTEGEIAQLARERDPDALSAVQEGE